MLQLPVSDKAKVTISSNEYIGHPTINRGHVRLLQNDEYIIDHLGESIVTSGSTNSYPLSEAISGGRKITTEVVDDKLLISLSGSTGINTYGSSIAGRLAIFQNSGDTMNDDQVFVTNSNYTEADIMQLRTDINNIILSGGGGGGGGNVIGSIMAFATSAAPSGWVECNGSVLAKEGDYSDLYDVIANESVSSTFGYSCDLSGNRTLSGTYFKIPDLRGEFVRGWDHGRGVDSGRNFASSQDDSFESHTHSVTLSTPPTVNTILDTYNGDGKTIAMGTAAGSTYTSTSAGGTETRPRNIALMYCICYQSIGGGVWISGVSGIEIGSISGLVLDTTYQFGGGVAQTVTTSGCFITSGSLEHSIPGTMSWDVANQITVGNNVSALFNFLNGTGTPSVSAMHIYDATKINIKEMFVSTQGHSSDMDIVIDWKNKKVFGTCQNGDYQSSVVYGDIDTNGNCTTTYSGTNYYNRGWPELKIENWKLTRIPSTNALWAGSSFFCITVENYKNGSGIISGTTNGLGTLSVNGLVYVSHGASPKSNLISSSYNEYYIDNTLGTAAGAAIVSWNPSVNQAATLSSCWSNVFAELDSLNLSDYKLTRLIISNGVVTTINVDIDWKNGKVFGCGNVRDAVSYGPCFYGNISGGNCTTSTVITTTEGTGYSTRLKIVNNKITELPAYAGSNGTNYTMRIECYS